MFSYFHPVRKISFCLTRYRWFCLVLLFFSLPANAQQNNQAQDDELLDSTVVDHPQSTTSESQADSSLVLRLENVFASLEGFEAINVHAQEGIVRLTGTAVDISKREQAAELAATFPGVLFVINDLETDIEIEARVTPAIERIQTYVSDAFAYLPILGIALLVLLIFSQIARFVDRLLPSFQRMGSSRMVGQLIVRLLRILLWIIGLVLALDILGITALVGAVLGTAGLMGIAIGFAFKDIIENYLAGLLLSARHPFKLNDHVRIDSEEGKVVRLTSRELVLMTLDGNHVRIPNGIVFKSTLYNYTRNPRRRFNFDAGVDVEEDLQRVQRIGTEALHSMSSIMADPGPFSLVRELGDFNVIVTFFGWVDQTQADFSKSRSEAIRLVKNALDEAGVLMPEPIYNVRMQSVEKDAGASSSNDVSQTRTQEKLTEGDVSVEKDLEKQIQDDLRASNEPNLLPESDG